MHLEYQQLFKDYPYIAERISILPGRVFSGKQHPRADSRGVFFCYAIPALEKKIVKEVAEDEEEVWTEEAGFSHWYLYDVDNKKILDDQLTLYDARLILLGIVHYRRKI